METFQTASKSTRPTWLLAPTAYKGTLSAVEAATLMRDSIQDTFGPGSISIDVCPVADGGDDTLLSLRSALPDVQVETLSVTGPVPGQTVSAQVGLLEGGTRAVVEAAQAHGLVRLPGGQLAPLEASSYGVGELIRKVLERHPAVKTLIVTLGGSASTDGGAGALQALGVKFLNTQGQALPVPVSARHLPEIARAEIPAGLLNGVSLVVATDVVNPLLGPTGTATVFAPQKGATPEDRRFLEAGLTKFSEVMQTATGRDLKNNPRMGAAGGLSYGLACLPGVTVVSGFDWLAEQVGLRARFDAADTILTAEGRLDSQSLSGKVIGRLMAWAAVATPPKRVLVFPGGAEPDLPLPPFAQVFPLATDEVSKAQAMANPAETLRAVLARVLPTLAPPPSRSTNPTGPGSSPDGTNKG